MSVFKRKGKGRGAEGVSKCYYGRYKDQHGKERTVRLCPDKRASEQMLAEKRRKVALIKVGLASEYDEHLERKLKEHLEDYEKDMIARGLNHKTIRNRVNTCERVMEDGGFVRFRDVDPLEVQSVLRDMFDRGKAQSSINEYLRRVKAFLNWMVEHDRAPNNPIKKLKASTVVENPRQRRALTVEEARRLISATKKATERWKMTGERRALLYRVALGTGLRRCELKQLRKKDFDLDAPIPFVTVKAAHAKNKKTQSVPIPKDLVGELKRIPDEGRLFPLETNTSYMIQDDLAEAGIPFKTDAGQVDFHALRHTYITWLVQKNVHPKVVQELARHSQITMTMDYYAHVDYNGKAAAIEKLDRIV